MADLEYWVWLSLAFGRANGVTDEILRRGANPEQLYNERGAAWLATGDNRRVRRPGLMDQARRIVERMAREKVDILSPENPRYPDRLRHIYASPCVLYVEGSLDGIDDQLAIAMVGARRCSDYGGRAAVQLGSDLARAGAVIVSGLAEGVDSFSHSAAVRNDGRTIAVLGNGIDKTYPAQNKALREQIVENGAVITEFAPGTQPYPGNFPLRNRIISGLALGVVVVEAGEHSGSLITAHLALEQGRDVFAVPGSIFSPSSKGTFRLLQQGAAPASCAEDILEGYLDRFEGVVQLEERTEEKIPEQGAAEGISAVEQEPAGLSESALAVYRMLAGQPVTMEEMTLHLQKPVSEVLTALTELEIMGLVSALSGGRYRRTPIR